VECCRVALVEALMGFQFNHVGGGTKTRRPVCLHMKYNSACKVPHCFLVDDSGQDQEMALEELQEFIEQENQKLNAENRFSNKDIIVKIHYRYCPNLTIVDTPGALTSLSATYMLQCRRSKTCESAAVPYYCTKFIV
jgi:Dynamin family